MVTWLASSTDSTLTTPPAGAVDTSHARDRTQSITAMFVSVNRAVFAESQQFIYRNQVHRPPTLFQRGISPDRIVKRRVERDRVVSRVPEQQHAVITGNDARSSRDAGRRHACDFVSILPTMRKNTLSAGWTRDCFIKITAEARYGVCVSDRTM